MPSIPRPPSTPPDDLTVVLTVRDDRVRALLPVPFPMERAWRTWPHGRLAVAQDDDEDPDILDDDFRQDVRDLIVQRLRDDPSIRTMSVDIGSETVDRIGEDGTHHPVRIALLTLEHVDAPPVRTPGAEADDEAFTDDPGLDHDGQGRLDLDEPDEDAPTLPPGSAVRLMNALREGLQARCPDLSLPPVLVIEDQALVALDERTADPGAVYALRSAQALESHRLREVVAQVAPGLAGDRPERRRL